MDPHGRTARRFPLVARFRPACLPLADRVRALGELADTAAHKADQGLASSVYNQAALLASDLDRPDLARAMCHQHADAYLHVCPLPGMSAIRGLEPVVNLARLHIRAGRTEHGRRHLALLYDAVSTATTVQLDHVTVPATLTATAEDRQEVRAWLWRVLLADGTRTLTTTGNWTRALTHIHQHHGIGTRMLDGRQVAVLAALTTGDAEHADELLTTTAPGEPWEDAITACLTVMCRRLAGRRVNHLLDDLTTTYLARQAEPGMTVFDIRLGHTTLDIVGPDHARAARRIVAELHRRATEASDGYAARDNLENPLFTTLATSQQVEDCRELVDACALNTGTFPDTVHHDLATALRVSDHVIRTSLASPFGPEAGQG